MNIRFIAAGVFLIAAFSSNAYALSIAGWGFKIGSIKAVLELRGVPNPDTKPTVAVFDLTQATIEYICVNPNGYNVYQPGVAGLRFEGLEGFDPIGVEDLIGKGKALAQKSIATPEDFNYACVNHNWTFVSGSAAVKSFDANLSYYYCSEDDETPCVDENGDPAYTTSKAAVVSVSCWVEEIARNSDGTVDKTYDQPYRCSPESPVLLTDFPE